jgi:non-specific serine/threonine protein kinase
LTWLGFVSNRREQFAEADRRLEEALALYRALGDGHGTAWVMHGLGAAAGNRDDYKRALACFEESLGRYQVLGDLRGVAITSQALGAATVFAGSSDLERADRLLRDGLRGLLAVGDRAFMISGLLTLAEAEARLGRRARAARLLGTFGALRDALGTRFAPLHVKIEATILGLIRPWLDETALAAALAAGRLLSVDQALAEILSDEQLELPSSAAPPPGAVEALTPREREVARLLAQGYSDRQIAEALTIALSTVGSHVHHLLAKLGVHSRWQVADWALAHGLGATPPD